MSLRRTDDERELLSRAARVLPGGTLGNVRLDDGYAFVVREGRGSKIWDISGNEYIDYLLGSGPMVLGNAHPAVIEAAEEAMRKGTTFFTQNEYAIELAEKITEAVALPRAIAFTGAGACTICSQDRQLYLGRTVRMTRHRTGATSSISSLSCPSGRRAPPQEGQVQVPASGSIRRSARGRCAGKARTGAGRSF